MKARGMEKACLEVGVEERKRGTGLRMEFERTCASIYLLVYLVKGYFGRPMSLTGSIQQGELCGMPTKRREEQLRRLSEGLSLCGWHP